MYSPWTTEERLERISTEETYSIITLRFALSKLTEAVQYCTVEVSTNKILTLLQVSRIQELFCWSCLRGPA